MNHSYNTNTENWLLDDPNNLISIGKWQKTVNLLAKLFDAPSGFLIQHTLVGFQITIASEQLSHHYSAGALVSADTNLFCRKTAETKEMLYISNASTDTYWDEYPEVKHDGVESYLGVPVFWPNGKIFGTFCVKDYKVTDYNQEYLDLIHQLKDILESDLLLIEMYQQVQHLAVTDPLTGIHNRRGFKTLAEQRIHLAKRMNSPLGLFYFDVDKFKSINDKYGHEKGDDVLKIIAEALTESIREADVIARMGGDEFVALVNVHNTDESNKILNRFNQSIINKQKSQDIPAFSVSAGYTTVDLDLTVKNIIKIADKAMFSNKI